MQNETVTMNRGAVKRHIIGGCTARAIYGAGGLAEQLRASRASRRSQMRAVKDPVYVGRRLFGHGSESWPVTVDGEELLTHQSYLSDSLEHGDNRYRWGGSDELGLNSLLLAMDLYLSVMGDLDAPFGVFLHLAREVIDDLPDTWFMTQSQIVAHISAYNLKEGSR